MIHARKQNLLPPQKVVLALPEQGSEDQTILLAVNKMMEQSQTQKIPILVVQALYREQAVTHHLHLSATLILSVIDLTAIIVPAG